MNTLLLIGGSGFVGSNFLTLGNELGFNRIVIVDPCELSDALKSNLRTGKVEVNHAASLQQVNADEITKAVCIAGATSVDAALAEPQNAHRVNIELAVELCEWLRNANQNIRTVYMSSDEVLGPTSVPLSEHAPLKPSQPYAASKAAAEIIIHNYCDVYNLNMATLRSCNLVGSGQKMPKLIPTIIDSYIAQKAVPIHGTGEQKREWMDVTDLCHAIQLLLNNGERGIFQAASGIHLSVNEIVKLIEIALNCKLETTHVDDRLIQDFDYAMEASKLRALGWSPSDPVKSVMSAAQKLFRQRSE